MRIGFDLDGTLYDSLAMLMGIDMKNMARLGYPLPRKDFYIRTFQSGDFAQFYRDLGVREEHVEEMRRLFHEEYKKAEQPELIPGAREALVKAETAVGLDNIYIVTNTPVGLVEKRFIRDDLMHYRPRLFTPAQGKAEALHQLATEAPHLPFAYVGDIVNDGQDCRSAREMGAANIMFYAIMHDFTMNAHEHLHGFVDAHPEFSRKIDGLHEVHRIWNGRH